MKNFYKTISRRLILSILILISCVFLTGLGFALEEVPDKAPQPSASETEPQAPEPAVPAPEPQETPQDGAVIDHPLPEDPILTDGPWASAHFLMDEYACDCAGYCDGWPAAMDQELLEKIEALRCYFDQYCPGVPYDEVAAAARALGLGVIEYPDQQFDHCEIWR